MRFLEACARRPVDATPVWLMRQAGRYMPEYRAIREKLSFIEMCRRPEVAAEVTLQPVGAFDLDAAIIFADILLPLEGMGIGFHFTDREGPVIERPVRQASDLDEVRPGRAARGPALRARGHPPGARRARRPAAADRLRRGAVHPGELHRRGRALARLRAREGPHVLGPARLGPPHGDRHRDGRRATCWRSSRRGRSACSSSIPGSARWRPTTTRSTSRPTRAPCSLA